MQDKPVQQMWQQHFGFSELKGRELRRVQSEYPRMAGYQGSLIMSKDLSRLPAGASSLGMEFGGLSSAAAHTGGGGAHAVEAALPNAEAGVEFAAEEAFALGRHALTGSGSEDGDAVRGSARAQGSHGTGGAAAAAVGAASGGLQPQQQEDQQPAGVAGSEGGRKPAWFDFMRGALGGGQQQGK